MSYIRIGTLACSLFAVTAVALAAEPDELRERARAMQREVAEHAERGREAEAEKLERRSFEMLEEAERRMRPTPEHRNPEIRERKERLKQLEIEAKHWTRIGGKEERLADIRHEAERIERELHEIAHDGHHEEADSHQEAARRLEHMRAAMEHLHHAGLNEIAEHVRKQAEATQHEMHEHERHHNDDPFHEIMRQLDEMRHEFGRLRQEVNELKRRRD